MTLPAMMMQDLTMQCRGRGAIALADRINCQRKQQFSRCVSQYHNLINDFHPLIIELIADKHPHSTSNEYSNPK